jgi:hypothetical protein
MSQKYFVKLELGNKSYKDKVSTEGCKYVSDFKEAIKNKWSHTLQSFDPAQLTLFGGDGISEIDPETEMNDVFVTKGKPLIVRVESVSRQAISSTRHQDYKHSKAIHSSRSYLTSIAVELEKLYELEKLKPNEPATFGDVLWNKKKQPKPKADHLPELKNFFYEPEWKNLIILNDLVNPELHAILPTLLDGKSKEVILPIDIAHLGPSFQNIAKKANVVGSESHLIVKCKV